MRSRASILAIAAAAAVLSLSSCAAPGARAGGAPVPVPSVTALNTAPADAVVMPKGFAPIATKCDHGNRIYESSPQGLSAGSLTVVGNDPSCKNQPSNPSPTALTSAPPQSS